MLVGWARFELATNGCLIRYSVMLRDRLSLPSNYRPTAYRSDAPHRPTDRWSDPLKCRMAVIGHQESLGLISANIWKI
jgi:hypothetical protein